MLAPVAESIPAKAIFQAFWGTKSTRLGEFLARRMARVTTDQVSRCTLTSAYQHWHVIRPAEGKTTIMGNLLYIIAVILVIGWLLGVFVYSATGLIHVLLVIALIAVILRIIQGRGLKG